MAVLSPYPPRAVHAHETDEEVIVEIELPNGGREVHVDVGAESLTVTVPRPAGPHQLRINADATPC